MRSVPGSDDGGERAARGEKETGDCLSEGGAVVARGMHQSGGIYPRVTRREHLNLTAALEDQLAGGECHQFLATMQMLRVQTPVPARSRPC